MNDELRAKKLCDFLAEKDSPANFFTNIAEIYSNKREDLAEYLFHLLVAITHLQKIENACRTWKKFCHGKRAWWGFGKKLSTQIEALNLRELRVSSVRMEIEHHANAVEIEIARRRYTERSTSGNCCSGEKVDCLASPINGDLQSVYTLVPDVMIDEERVGTHPTQHKEILSRENAWARDGSN